MGFVIEDEDLELLLTEIKRFIDYYDIKPNEDGEKFLTVSGIQAEKILDDFFLKVHTDQ